MQCMSRRKRARTLAASCRSNAFDDINGAACVLLTPHANMPNYRLTSEEIDDIVAYILSLRR